jgi:hypothetical protein
MLTILVFEIKEGKNAQIKSTLKPINIGVIVFNYSL